MKSNLGKKKKKKVQGITGDVKVTSTEDAENDKRKASIKNNVVKDKYKNIYVYIYLCIYIYIYNTSLYVEKRDVQSIFIS